MRAASHRVCEFAWDESASLRVTSLRVESSRVTSFERKNYIPVKDASDIYLSRVKHWHVAILGIILSKACDNKAADMCTFCVRICHTLGFLMTWLR